MPLKDDLRYLYGNDLSDDELLVKASDELKVPMGKLASEAGISVSGKWTNRASAGIDAGQSQLLETTSALSRGLGLDGVHDWAENRAARNKSQAEAQQRIAGEQGAVQDWRDVRGLGSGLEFAAGTVLDSAPQMAATVGGGLAGGLVGGAVAGPAGAVGGAMIGSGLAGAGFNYGDVRGNMREQLKGAEPTQEQDLLALGPAAVYTGIDALTGAGGAVAKGAGKIGGAITKAAGKEALEHGGEAAVKGGLKEYGKQLGKTTLEETLGEPAQEVMNQWGRNIVDPDAGYFGDEAVKRYIDSAVGGFAAGGLTGGVTSLGSLRSRPATAPATKPPIDETGGTDLLQPLALGWNGKLGVGAEGDQGVMVSPPIQGAPLPGSTTTVEGAMGQPAPAPGAVPAPPAPPPTPREQAKQTFKQQMQEVHDELGLDKDGVNEDGQKFSLEKRIKLGNVMRQLKALHADEKIDDDRLNMGLELLSQGLDGTVAKEIATWSKENAPAEKTTGAAAPAQPAVAAPAVAAPAAPAEAGAVSTAQPAVSKGPAAGAVVPATSGPTVSGASQTAAVPAAPSTAATTTPAAATAAPATAAPAPVEAAAAPAPAVAPKKTIGAKFAEGAAKVAGKELNDVDRQTIYAVAGFDENGEQISAPRTMEQAIEIMKARGVKSGAARSTINTRLKKYGVTTAVLEALGRRYSELHADDNVAPGQEAAIAEEAARKEFGEAAKIDTANTEDEANIDIEGEKGDAAERGEERPEGVPKEEGAEEDEDTDGGEGYSIRAEGEENVGNDRNESAGRDLQEMVRKTVDTDARLTPEQKMVLGAIIDKRTAVAKGQEEGDKSLKTFRADLRKALANKNLFPDRAVADDLTAQFKSTEGRARKAAEAKELAAKQEAERKAEEARVAVINEAARKQLAEEQAEQESEEALAAQWREQMMMSAEGRQQLLTEALHPELHKSIPDAIEAWDEDVIENQPAFDDLDTDLQAQWVRFTARRYGDIPSLTAQQYAREAGQLMQEAQNKGYVRNRYGQDQTSPAAVGPVGQAGETAAGQAGQDGVAGPQAAPAYAAEPGDQGRGEPAGVQAAADRAAEGPAANEDEGGADDGQRTGTLENIERITMTGAAPAGTQTVTGRQRKPSVVRVVRRAAALLDEGTITADQFAAQTSAALDAADQVESHANVQRQRGHLILREKLLAAQRRGELNADMVEFADWMLRQNPQWATDLGISIKDSEAKGVPQGTSGFYTPVSRILTLVKGTSSSETAVHEVLHHIERMMPMPIQNAIRREWARQFARQYRAAQKGQNEDLKTYFKELMKYHYGGGDPSNSKAAMKLLKDGKVPYSMYQYFNQSEFWAINGTDIMSARYGVSESIVGRIRNWLNEFVERVKGTFGFESNRSIINALNSLGHSDGQYRTGTMISGQPGVHFMYAGEAAATQEQMSQLKVAQAEDATGKDMEDIRFETGWFKGLDDKWRYEFSDYNAKWKNDFDLANTYDPHGPQDARDRGTLRLGDYLDHPQLFKRYPEAADIKLRRDTSLKAGELGGFYPSSNVIELNASLMGNQAMDTLVHEVQHWIQNKEGFATGGSADNVVAKLSPERLEKEWQKIRPKILDSALKSNARVSDLRTAREWGKAAELEATTKAWAEKVKEVRAFQLDALDANVSFVEDPDYQRLGAEADALEARKNAMTQELMDRIKAQPYHAAAVARFGEQDRETMLHGLKAAVQQNGSNLQESIERNSKIATEDYDRVTTADTDPMRKRVMVAVHGEAFKLYKALAGEIEARDTTERRKMKMEDRRVFTPYEATMASGDIGPEQVVVAFKGDKASSSTQEEPGFQNIETITKGFPPKVSQTAYIARDIAVGLKNGKVAQWLQAARFTRDLMQSAVKLLPSADGYAKAMDAVAARRTAMQREVSRLHDDFFRLPQSQRDVANKFMHDSTISDKWGFVPSWVKDFKPEQLDGAMNARFRQLDDATQKIVMDMFHHQHKDLLAQRAALEAKANIVYAGDAAGRQRFMERFDKLSRIAENTPYMPLKRFGNYVVYARSAELQQAIRDGDKKLIAKLEQDGEHYQVSYRETRGEAETLRRTLDQQFPEGTVKVATRDDGYSGAFASGVQTLGLVARMRNMSEEADVNEKSKKAMAKLLADFELGMLSEQSVRQSERRRKNIHGADADMARSFATKGMASANFIAAMEAAGAPENMLAQMKVEARTASSKDSEAASRYFNEISKRHYMGFDYTPSPLAEAALRTASVFQLMFNPAYHLVNALQPLTMSAPWLAGKHGLGRTYAAFGKAYRELAPNIKEISRAIEHDDYSKLPEDVRGVVQQLVARGAISADQIFEHGRLGWKTDDPSNPAAKALRKTNEAMNYVGSTVELTNRLTTAMAAYRLAGGASNPTAVESAYRAIYETHGDYSGFNAPRAMRHPVARVMTQYRKFQMIQLGLWGRLMRDSLNRDGKLSADEAWVARKQLAFSLGTMQAVAGSLGLPGAQMIGIVLNGIFGDADDPDDPEMKMRKLIGDPHVADLLLKGIPAALGVDMSGKLGADRLLTPLPFSDPAMDRDGYSRMVMAALGPFIGGLLPKTFDGVGQFATGNYMKGVENILPTGLGNALKGMRLATMGMTQKNGDLVMTPDEISAFDGIMQAVGLPTDKITDRALVQKTKFDSDKFFKERTTELKHDYTRAYKSGDTEALAEARQRWAEVNASRVAHGYKPQPLSDLLKAPREQVKREKSARAGVIPAGRRDANVLRVLQEATE